jgi:GrpB-like predicted nucleotidyltransferase (UPF0157 family)
MILKVRPISQSSEEIFIVLENLSLEELWKLFPIYFVDSNAEFEQQFSDEKEYLISLLGDYVKRISHVGSTAIKNIKTKPIVDILIEIDFADNDIVKEILLDNHYVLMCETPDKISLNKGYTANGYADKVFHIHIKKYGDCDELYFRDYLNDNDEKAKEYEKLKEELYNKYNPNRDLYTAGKSDFVNAVTESAKMKYGNKY